MNRNHLLIVVTVLFSTSLFSQTDASLKRALSLAASGHWEQAFKQIDAQVAAGECVTLEFWEKLFQEAFRQDNVEYRQRVQQRIVFATSPAGVFCTPISPEGRAGLDSTNVRRDRRLTDAVEDIDDGYEPKVFDDDELQIVKCLNLENSISNSNN